MQAAHSEQDAFDNGHSIANCPSMADGAALVLLGTRAAREAVGLSPNARIVAKVEAADDPVLQLKARMLAMVQVMNNADMAIDDFDRDEFMEALAALQMNFLPDYRPIEDRANLNGGHLAMEQPMGVTGAALLTKPVRELERCDGTTGLDVAQAGSGVGSEMIVERV